MMDSFRSAVEFFDEYPHVIFLLFSSLTMNFVFVSLLWNK